MDLLNLIKPLISFIKGLLERLKLYLHQGHISVRVLKLLKFETIIAFHLVREQLLESDDIYYLGVQSLHIDLDLLRLSQNLLLLTLKSADFIGRVTRFTRRQSRALAHAKDSTEFRTDRAQP